MFSSGTVMRWAVVLTAALASVRFATTTAETSGVVVSFEAPYVVVMHEPIIVEVLLDNRSADTVHFDLGFNRQAGFALQVKSPDGIVHTPRIVPRDVGRTGRLVLKPNEKISHQLLLNDWLRFDQLGSYEIAIQLTGPILTASGAPVETSTATQFQLDVGRADPSTLQRVCQQLADTIIGSKSAEDSLNAARAISSISDPVVLPFMKEILSATDKVDPILVEGLVRMNHAGEIVKCCGSAA